ncbi:MAG: serine hydrolase domain-containing protein, partial [Blastocatellia bacterium]
HGLPVTPKTLFPIGSATKAFTAMAAAISVDQGKLSFDDSPHKYLPYFKLQDPDANSKVQLRDMLSHKTGLANYTDLPWVVGTLSRQEVIEVVGEAKPTAPLRAKFQYNNVMFSAAGEVVAAAQKSSYEQVIQDLIFKPLGMNSSDLYVKVMEKSPDFSRGYEYDKDTKKARLLPTRDLTAIAAAGAINSNALDMSRWVRLMLGGGVFEGKRLVSEKSFHELVSPQTPLGAGVAYGFGWVLASWRGHKTIWHNGGIDGFHSLVDMIPDEHLGFVILSNDQGSQLEGPFTDIIFSNLVSESKKSGEDAKSTGGMGSGSPLSDAEAKELIASYKNPALTVKLAPVGGKPALVVEGQPAYPLVEKSKDSLVSTA